MAEMVGYQLEPMSQAYQASKGEQRIIVTLPNSHWL